MVVITYQSHERLWDCRAHPGQYEQNMIMRRRQPDHSRTEPGPNCSVRDPCRPVLRGYRVRGSLRPAWKPLAWSKGVDAPALLRTDECSPRRSSEALAAAIPLI